jgi:carbon-monoxide dehydrogenase large subunit
MPRAHHLPPITLVDCGTPSPANPLGAKGAGEAGATGSVPALANAVLNALKFANVRELDTPYTSARIWGALHNSNKAGRTVWAIAGNQSKVHL